MSYSYIKSVFPNFETSKVYGEDIYNNITLNSSQKNNSMEQPKFETKPLNAETYVSPFNLNESRIKNEIKSDNKNIEQAIKEDKDNLKFYNLPFTPNNLYPEAPEVKQKNVVEKFEDSDDNDHNKYILHVLECKKCKESLIKQLNIFDDKIKLESYMELISYIIFGVFIILLIDTINKK